MVSISSIKARLRINHNALNNQIEQDINTAKAELCRVGVSSAAVEREDDPLIDEAIISYCMMVECSIDSKMYDAYKEQWIQRKDELRKSANYGYNVSTEPEESDSEDESSETDDNLTEVVDSNV